MFNLIKYLEDTNTVIHCETDDDCNKIIDYLNSIDEKWFNISDKLFSYMFSTYGTVCLRKRNNSWVYDSLTWCKENGFHIMTVKNFFELLENKAYNDNYEETVNKLYNLLKSVTIDDDRFLIKQQTRTNNKEEKMEPKYKPFNVTWSCNFANSDIKPVIEKKYENKSNEEEPILYIILNKDANLMDGEKFVTISHLTSRILSNYYDDDYFSKGIDEWLKSHNGFGNTVILEATEEEIYENCMSVYDNVRFVKYIEDTERVAQNNYKLTLPLHYGVAFLGVKKEIPKWVKRLQLAK